MGVGRTWNIETNLAKPRSARLIWLFRLDKEEEGLKDDDRSVFKGIAIKTVVLRNPRTLYCAGG